MVSDGFVKSPAVPLGAGLRFNFVVAAHPLVRLTPQFSRALHLELFTKPSSGDYLKGPLFLWLLKKLQMSRSERDCGATLVAAHL
jgi:hypothetical protein